MIGNTNIKMGDIRAELGYPNWQVPSNINDKAFRTMCGKTSGRIALSDFAGKAGYIEQYINCGVATTFTMYAPVYTYPSSSFAIQVEPLGSGWSRVSVFGIDAPWRVWELYSERFGWRSLNKVGLGRWQNDVMGTWVDTFRVWPNSSTIT